MQQRKRQHWILPAVLALVVVMCFALWFLRVDVADRIVVFSDTPEWNLSEYNLDEEYVWARGSVAEYVPHALLSPDEFEQADYLVGKPKNSADYLTSRFRLYVPDGKVYVLTTDSVDYADRIYINGQLYDEIGIPASTRAAMVPQTQTVYFTVEPEDGVIEIVQQVSNFVHREGGNPVGFRIGSFETAGVHYNRILTMSAVLVGFGLLLFLVHLTLYILQRGYRANLYFALFCLVWSVQTLVSSARLIVALFPHIPWELTFRVGYMSIPLCALFLALALGAMFPGLMQRAVKWLTVGVMTAIALVYAFADTVFMSHMSNVTNVLCIVLALYLIARLLWRVRIKENRTIELGIILTGLAILAYALLRDTLYHNDMNIFPRVDAEFVGFAVPVFVLFQMIVNFHGTMQQVRAAEERHQRLAAENAALDRVNTLKTELMANLTHELRTPLAVMSVYAQLTAEAVRDGTVDEQTTRDLDLVSSESKRLANMASDLLSIFQNKAATSEKEHFDLHTVVAQVTRLAAPLLEREKNTLVLEIPENLPSLYGRTEECTQLIWNILANANSHTQNGVIALRIGVIPPEKPQGTAVLCLVIQDNGSGIDPKLLPHVFERKHSDTEERTGLGLVICKEIVEAHEGSITIESVLGQGTTVRITLPASPQEEQDIESYLIRR